MRIFQLANFRPILRAIGVLLLLVGLLVTKTTRVQAASPPIADDSDLVLLRGNLHPLARLEFDRGRTDPSIPAERMILALRVRLDKQAALEQFLSEQQDPRSSHYHRWLTPEEFGERFGRTPEEIEIVTTWLQSHGFSIDEIAKAGTWVNFSGTVGSVERAFHTEIHDYYIAGELHQANAFDPAIPKAIADLVVGPVSLNNFQKRAHESDSNGNHFLAPADFENIYNLAPLYTAGIDGSGVTIAIVGRTDINLADVQYFRLHFGLPAKDPSFVLNGTDPGIVCTDPSHCDEAEAILDVEWAGAVAKKANVNLVTSKSSFWLWQVFGLGSDGIDLSAQYIVNSNNPPQIMSVSYGECESAMGSSGNSFYRQQWSQAAAEGITVVVSAGDAGASGCSSGGDSTGSGPAVSGLCSTPYNVCVGGTQFDDTSNPNTYWSPVNDPTTQGSALLPIPERAWNESGTVGGITTLWATGGGVSGIYTTKPAWQESLGVPNDGRRDVPDVSLAAAGGHDAYLVVSGHTSTITGISSTGGTSASAPAFAGLMALIVQKTGQRQGNPNPVLYQLARAQYSGGGPKVFHDILRGTNDVPGTAGFDCTEGYDLVTGLGSVDATALVNNWPALGATLSANPSTGVAPLWTELTAQATGEGFGTLNYTFWWNCPFAVATVAQGIQQCDDPTNPAIGAKFDSVSDLSKSVTRTYPTAQINKPLVIIERNNGAVTATASVTVSSAATCTNFTVSPSSVGPSSAAGSQQVAVVGSPVGCQGGTWTAAGNGSWITVSPASGSGNGSVTVSWAANASITSRSANATIAGSSVLVTQAGTAAAPAPPFLLSPGAAVFPGTTTNLLSPGFFWQTAPGADSYQLELSDASTVYPVQTISAPQTSTVLSFSLADNHSFKWRMRSHGAAGFGAFGVYYYFSTYTGLSTGDFSISPSPSTASVTPGASASFILGTTTVQGTSQTLSFSSGSLPAGVSSSFSSTSIQSGGQTTLTLNVGAGTAQGSYAITISATSSVSVTHTVTIGLTINPAPGTAESAVCLTPSSLGFSDQMVGTSSVTQLVTLRNCGNGQLHVSSIGASPEFFIGPGSIVPPVDLPTGTAATFQVGFAPLASGPRSGSVKVFSNATGSPVVLSLSGNATPAPTTTGTVNVLATLNGQPFSGEMVFSVTGPGGTIDFGNVPLNWPNQGAGSYTVGFIAQAPGGVGGGALVSITPSSTQTLTAGGSILFTFNFVAPDDFSFSCPTATFIGTTALLIPPPSGSASVPLSVGYQSGASQTVSLAVSGLPANATISFDPQPLVVFGASASSTFTVATGSSTPPGLYQLTFSATNQDGITHTLTGTLVVVTNPNPQLLSGGVGSVPADGLSDLPSVSADGRYVAFWSLATNLVAGGDANGASNGDVYVRDRQTGTTSRVSVADDGTQGDDSSADNVSISADGRFVAFRSVAGNLIPGGRRGFGDVYVRDRQLGHTIRVSLSSAGVPADAGCFYPSISGNGRYVAFNSSATNLVPGGGGGVSQVYVRDLLMGTTSLASIADDNSIGDGSSTNPVISGDGRYVAFYSTASNFVPDATAAGRQVFIRDLVAGTTQVVSGAPDGSPANANAELDSEERLAISPDGRFVAFTSPASNLVPGDNNANNDVFVWDRTTKTATIVSVTNDGSLLSGSYAPAISADGRFIAFRFLIAGAQNVQIGLRDTATHRTLIYSVGPGSALGSGPSADSALSADGRVLVFASGASNLVTGDTNGQQDIFSVALPTSGTPFAQTLSVTPASVSGGSTATGIVTLSGPAPAGGSSVALSSSDLEAQVPSVVTVPAGSSSVSFSIPTLSVSAELPVSLTASYGGGSPWTLLLLEKAVPARVDVLQGDGQGVTIGSLLQTQLSVRVLDSANNPAANVAVQFSAPSTGPSGAFSGGVTSVLVVTDSLGIATAPAFTANGVLGQYAVIAYAVGISSPAVFSITNRGSAIFSSGFESGSLAGWLPTPP